MCGRLPIEVVVLPVVLPLSNLDESRASGRAPAAMYACR